MIKVDQDEFLHVEIKTLGPVANSQNVSADNGSTDFALERSNVGSSKKVVEEVKTVRELEEACDNQVVVLRQLLGQEGLRVNSWSEHSGSGSAGRLGS